MALDLTVQPWIKEMLMPADPRLLGEAVSDFAGGFAGSYLRAKSQQRQASVERGEPPVGPSGLESFLKNAFPDAQRSVDETLSLDLKTIGSEIGQLKTSEDILKWVARNSALAANPVGSRVLSQIGATAAHMVQIESESVGHITAKKLAQEKGELMVKYGLGPNATPEQMATARASENEMKFMEQAARSLNRDVTGLVSPQDFDTNGNWLPGAQQRLLKSAAPLQPRTQADKLEIASAMSRYQAIIADPNSTTEMRSIAERELTNIQSLGGTTEFTPSTGTVTNPVTQEQIPYVKTSRGGAQLLIEPTVESFTDPSTGQRRSMLRTGASGARVLPEDVGTRQVAQAKRQNEAAITKWALDNRPDLLARGEDGVYRLPQERFDEVATLARTAPTVRADAQKKTASITTGLAELDRAEQVIRGVPEAFGALGIAKEAVEQFRGVFDANTPAPITKARHEAALTFTKLADSLRVDVGNMSLYERTQLEKVGDVTGWRDRPPAALAKYENIRNALIGQKLRNLKLTQQRPDDTFLRQIPGSEIIALYRDNLLNDEDALRWQSLKPDESKP